MARASAARYRASVPPVLYLARHAETVFNAGARMQGNLAHTPLTRAGFAQADAMGAALAAADLRDIDLWVSPAGRTQQTAAIVAEHLGRDFWEWRHDARLLEIDVGDWTGRSYAELLADIGPFLDPARRLFTQRPPNGEWYDDIARRLAAWLADLDPARPALVISHGVTARVLRGMLVGGEPHPDGGTLIARDAPQGTVFRIEHGAERAIHIGTGAGAAVTA